MIKLKIYLDTSVYSALFDKRDLSRQKITKEFWDTIDKYEIFVSELNEQEIDGIADVNIKKEILTLIKRGKKITVTSEVRNLADKYLQSGIIPERFSDDALHLALVTVYSLDLIISWNFKHLVKRKTRIEVNLINSKEGYRSIDILAPPEL